MRIFKFGGASLKNARSFKNIHNIINYNQNLTIVVSAIDKTTNKLEKLCSEYFFNSKDKFLVFNQIKDFHFNLCKDLFSNNIPSKLEKLFKELEIKIQSQASENFDFEYDQIVHYGELFSSVIVYEYLKNDFEIQLLNIQDVLITDNSHREAKVNWEKSKRNILDYYNSNKKNIIITQGFIASSDGGVKTTLGREGSDYTAAILSYILDVENLTIWKDVPGIMNADPAKCSFAEKIDLLSYQEAIELAFYGAKVIHPKTIKPLENKGIKLYVKSFINPQQKGTLIENLNYKPDFIPIYILKDNQTLISISPKDFSFIVEENISKLFALFVKYRIKVNMTQNSAISFSASIDNNFGNINELLKELQQEYQVKYNENLELITIRHYNKEAIDKMTNNRQIYLEQRTRITARFVVSKIGNMH